MLSEEQVDETTRYGYKFKFEPLEPNRTDAGEISNAELQAYIRDLLGLRKESVVDSEQLEK